MNTNDQDGQEMTMNDATTITLERERRIRKVRVTSAAKLLGCYVVAQATKNVPLKYTNRVPRRHQLFNSDDDGNDIDWNDRDSVLEDVWELMKRDDDDDAGANDEWRRLSETVYALAEAVATLKDETFRQLMDAFARQPHCVETFVQMVRTMLKESDDGICSWDKIVTTYAFAIAFARRVAADAVAAEADGDIYAAIVYTRVVRSVGMALGDFVAHHLSNWILDNGDWTAMIDRFADSPLLLSQQHQRQERKRQQQEQKRQKLWQCYASFKEKNSLVCFLIGFASAAFVGGAVTYISVVGVVKLCSVVVSYVFP